MTRYIPGDVVKTQWGNGVIMEASEIRNGGVINWEQGTDDGYSSYSVSHLPGYTPRIWENGVGHGPKYAWYGNDELELVAQSAARAFLKS